MKKPLKILIPILAMASLVSCGHEPDVAETNVSSVATAQPSATQPPKKEEEKYVYRGDSHPDPFVPQNIEAAASPSGELITPNIATLSLKGIFSAGKQRTAIIAGASGAYILKDSRLYDSRQRQVKGISGAIKVDSVILISQDKNMRELKLREKE
jgi:hypothetical protein